MIRTTRTADGAEVRGCGPCEGAGVQGARVLAAPASVTRAHDAPSHRAPSNFRTAAPSHVSHHGVLALAALAMLLAPSEATAQAREPRRQFVTLSLDGLHTFPLRFKEYPLEELARRSLDEVRGEAIDYRSEDGRTTVDVLEFRRRARGAGVTVYPLGARNGATLAVRASYETLPVIRFVIDDAESRIGYSLRDGRAYDLGIGVIVNDRPPGWGLGAHSFVRGGVGRIRGERGEGERVFGEAGGGVSVGPFGVQFAVKVAYNKLDDPEAHAFYTVPFTFRATVSF